MRHIDVSHTVIHGMTTYPGLPGPVISDHLTRETSRVVLAGYGVPDRAHRDGRQHGHLPRHAGAPARTAGAWPELPLECVALVPAGTPEYGGAAHPHLTAETAGALVDAGAAVVGIDSVTIDDTSGGERPAHTTLLAAGIPTVEHLRGLDAVPSVEGSTFTATPVKVAGMGTFPVRAFVSVP